MLKNPLGPLSEVAYSVQASDWSGGRCRGREGDSTPPVASLAKIRSEDQGFTESNGNLAPACRNSAIS